MAAMVISVIAPPVTIPPMAPLEIACCDTWRVVVIAAVPVPVAVAVPVAGGVVPRVTEAGVAGIAFSGTVPLQF